MPPRSEAEQEDVAPSALTWTVACADVDRVPAQTGYAKAGYVKTWAATEAERTAVAEALDLTQCFSVSGTFTIHARAGGRYVLEGRLRADVEQACVVTLEAVPQHIDERFKVNSARNPISPPPALSRRISILTPPTIRSASSTGSCTVGQLVFENLALAIDPFPRAADAEDVRLERGPTGPTKANDAVSERAPNPFAVLAKLKPDKAE